MNQYANVLGYVCNETFYHSAYNFIQLLKNELHR